MSIIEGHSVKRQYKRHWFGIAAIALLAACDDEPEVTEETVRPIRTVVVSEAANGQIRSFSAIVEASDSSDLSFQVGGTVKEIFVSQGDQVPAGQVLALLDQEPFELDVKAAEANLQQANADLENNRADFERQQRLYEQGWVARVRYENAQRDYLSASSRVNYAVARLNLAKRDLANTELKAPFDGVIASRDIDAFIEITPGQLAFQIEADAGFDASFGVAESSIGEIVLGKAAQVRVPQVPIPLDGLVSEIGSSASAGNLFPVQVALIDPPSAVRAGMTAEVTISLGQDESGSGYFVPLTAIAASEQPEKGFVFVYDAGSSTVRRTAVTPTETLIGNMVAITGVAAGDIIATAGVNFLNDGQKVRLLEPVSDES